MDSVPRSATPSLVPAILGGVVAAAIAFLMGAVNWIARPGLDLSAPASQASATTPPHPDSESPRPDNDTPLRTAEALAPLEAGPVVR